MPFIISTANICLPQALKPRQESEKLVLNNQPSTKELNSSAVSAPAQGCQIKKVLVALGNNPPLDDSARKLLKKVAEVSVAPISVTEDELVAMSRDVNAVILGAPKLTRRVIMAARKLEVIARRGIGVDNIDLQAATKKGVVVTNLPGVLSSTVAEHTLLLMLGISRKIQLADRAARAGRWTEFTLALHTELRRKTLGIIGLGSIGYEVARIARDGFGMEIVTNRNPHLKKERVRRAHAKVVSLDQLLRSADYVLLAVPLTRESDGMIGARELNLMKPSAFLVNIARGKLVDEEALTRALREGRIAGAALDVLMKQPPDLDNPLLSLDNVLLTPHCAGLTGETLRELSLQSVQAVTKLFKGEMPKSPVNVLNLEVAQAYLAGKK
jgi:D-3-phosphoglycerate dehydrogenase